MPNSLEETARRRIESTHQSPGTAIEFAIHITRNETKQRRTPNAGTGPREFSTAQSNERFIDCVIAAGPKKKRVVIAIATAATMKAYGRMEQDIQTSSPCVCQKWRFKNSVAIINAAKRQSTEIDWLLGSGSNQRNRSTTFRHRVIHRCSAMIFLSAAIRFSINQTGQPEITVEAEPSPRTGKSHQRPPNAFGVVLVDGKTGTLRVEAGSNQLKTEFRLAVQ